MASSQATPASRVGEDPRTGSGPVRTPRKRRPRSHSQKLASRSRLLFMPSVLASLFFVYLFIGATIYISLSNWRLGTSRDLSIREPLGATYGEIFAEQRFQADIRNITIFTVLFLVIAVLGGLAAALLVHHVAVGAGVFRLIFMLPYALSFIVTGVVWRWIFNPGSGVNVLLEGLGVENPPGWTTDTRVLGALNEASGTEFLRIELGIPVALIPIVIGAAWQLTGFAMAIFLAGLAAIPEEYLEAAQIDGAGLWQRLRHVVLPQLAPSSVTAIVLLLHVALKIFDLIMAMSGSGPGFVTDVPGIYVYDYLTSRYDKASAASIVMLVMTLIFIIPYLMRSYRRDKEA